MSDRHGIRNYDARLESEAKFDIEDAEYWTGRQRPMRAITIQQPWASRIAWGLKAYETRGWKTKYRGEILIHAGMNRSHLTLFTPRPWEYPLGAVLAVGTLSEVYPTEEKAGGISSEERDWGDWGPGRYAWHLTDVRALDHPIAARGRQGLWRPSNSLVDQVRDSLRQRRHRMTTWEQTVIDISVPDAKGPLQAQDMGGNWHRYRVIQVVGHIHAAAAGLAVTPWRNGLYGIDGENEWEPGVYSITHIASGALVHGQGYNLALAKDVMLGLGPLTDWTQSWDDFRESDPELPERARLIADSIVNSRASHAEVTQYGPGD